MIVLHPPRLGLHGAVWMVHAVAHHHDRAGLLVKAVLPVAAVVPVGEEPRPVDLPVVDDPILTRAFILVNDDALKYFHDAMKYFPYSQTSPVLCSCPKSVGTPSCPAGLRGTPRRSRRQSCRTSCTRTSPSWWGAPSARPRCPSSL